MSAVEISENDWNKVDEAILRVAFSTTRGEDPGCGEIHRVLDDLAGRYGRHPKILSTKADFTRDPNQQIGYYREALVEDSEEDLRIQIITALLPLLIAAPYECCTQESCDGIESYLSELEAFARKSDDPANIALCSSLERAYRQRTSNW